MNDRTYLVSGMTCDHCVQAVTAELLQVPGINAVQIDLASGRVTVTSNGTPDDEAVAAAVDEAGYAVVT
jgi:copper chaperone